MKLISSFLNLFCLVQLLLFSHGKEQVEEACLALDGSTTTDKTACAGGAEFEQHQKRLKELEEYGEDLGVRQGFDDHEKDTILPVLEKARSYMRNIVHQDPRYEPIREDCKLLHFSCGFWAAKGECENNARYMNITCAPVCQSCDFLLSLREMTAHAVEPATADESVFENGQDMGEPQGIPAEHDAEVRAKIHAAREYLRSALFDKHPYIELRDTCKNQVASCAYWSVLGECKNNPAYMNMTCGPICQACEYRLKEIRCPLDPNAVDAFSPGQLQAMFERITSHPDFTHFEPKALSRPDLLPGDTEASAPYKLGPWIVTLENFLSSEEAARLIELGAAIGYQRSGKQGNLKFDGTYETYYDDGRTSTNAWCADACLVDPVTKAVTERITNLTGVPEPNLEFFQILKYDVGQFYQTHHDYMPHHVRRQEGVRVLTVYLYLNDVEEGGGTNFPVLDLTVMPKRGRVVIWPSVFNEEPNERDDRTDHQALPVIKGVKYGTNAWIHMRDFKTPFANGCE